MNKKVAIIGNGWVGKAMQDLFPDAITYVRSLKPEHALKRITDDKSLINDHDIAFICVPTPAGKDGRLDTSIVEECIRWCECPLIVIRSTVNPGDCASWSFKYGKRIVMQPEYLGETPSHPLLDSKQTRFLIIGGEPKDREELIYLYTTVYNANVKIRQVSSSEAEIIKLSENRAIAFKVMQCQELYDVCKMVGKQGIDYYTIRDAVYGDDPRFNLWWTFIYPDKRGFNSSKCLVKDVPAWCAWAESLGYDPKVTKTLVERSNEYAG